ncbi:MAG: hypothetical protein BroJett003_09530 [Planctomycetota bacterium]|nr:MAG: hypothetical protein BroJett003_09530 [Planctomycetota bacterium]
MSRSLIVLMLAYAALRAPSAAATPTDKNGVAAQAISRPAGPGSLEGLGDAFQPILNSGTAQHSVALMLPRGVTGLTPTLTLRYDGGDGFGEAGVGWSFEPGSVRRQVDEGLPRYGQSPDGEDVPDRFLGMDGEELVPLQNSYWLAKVERLYVRYRFTGSHWEAHTKDGVRLEFGVTPQGRLTSADGTQVYAWRLERQTDPHGNVVEYRYVLPNANDRRIYLSEIEYAPGAPPWAHRYRVQFMYEDRPDAFVDYRSGFAVRTSKRLSRVDVQYDGDLIRRYELTYAAHPHWSLLSRVTTIGADGVSALPSTTFEYSAFRSGDGSAPISAAGAVIETRGEPPEALDSEHTELTDLDADGLPDLLVTGTGHTGYLNRGLRREGDAAWIQFEGPLAVEAREQRALTYDLASPKVHLADMTGDGVADLVAAGSDDEVEYFASTGQVGWSAGRRMSAGHRPPPAPFGEGNRNVRMSDLSLNKRIDVLQSDNGALLAWYNQGNGTYTGPILTDAPRDGSRPVEFSDPGVFLVDVNGDRVPDVAKITAVGVLWWPGSGYARFGARREMRLPDRALDDRPGGNLERARLEDISGDGLADLVVERARGDELWFWQNLGDDRLDTSRVVIDLPVTPGATAHWADLNGSGTTDLIYANSSLPSSRLRCVDLGELIGGTSHANLLTLIDNGYGRKTKIAYRTTCDLAVEARFAGNPWTMNAPFPVHVVAETRSAIGLDLDGYPDEGPDGDEYVTRFVYRDAYYDPVEHQFRGFAFVKQINLGDERFGGSDAPTQVLRHAFHTGAPDGVDNDDDEEVDEEGDLWTGREEEPLKGVLLWSESTALPDDPLRDGGFADDAAVFERTLATWRIRDLCRADGGALVDLLGDGYRAADAYRRDVRQSAQTLTDRILIEQGRALSRTIRVRADLSPLGNALFEWSEGDLGNPDDDLHTAFEYALNEPAWIVDRVSRVVQSAGGPGGAFVSETRNFYDGASFVGLPLGEVGGRGVLHRTQALVSGGAVPPLTERSFAVGDPRDPDGVVDTFRQEVDAFGNPVVIRDANENDRLIIYDADFPIFPVREEIVLGEGGPELMIDAEYDRRFGVVKSLTDFNGQITRFTFDVFGRLVDELRPGDSGGRPTRRYIYELAAPISSIRTVLRDNVGGAPNVSVRAFFDGLGRPLGTFETGGPVMRDVTLYNARGLPRQSFMPYAGGSGTWSAPPPETPATTSRYDALGRVIEALSPPDADGLRARATTVYLPLAVRQHDAEDNAGGSHADTPVTTYSDGLGRVIEVHEIETLSQTDSGTFITRYRYALPAQLAEVEDAGGNVKYMRYDGLGRRLFINDLDRGHVTYTYDAVGNLLRRRDALGQEIVYAYDAAARLVFEDYLDDGHPLSAGRTPDVAYHYDAPHPDFPALARQRGKLSWVADLTGEEVLGYNAFGDLETVVKRIDQPDGSRRDYISRMLLDNLGRTVQMTFPDGGAVRYAYDARGLLFSVPGFVEQLTYAPSRRKETCLLSSGVITGYAYDPRQRLTRLTTDAPGAVLQDLAYRYDQVSNILGVDDGRTDVPGDDPRNMTAAFTVDNLYRLTRAAGTGFPAIRYDYDRLGNLALQTSDDANNDDVHLGQMRYGGSGGTSGRVGRAPGDPPGPHALTRTDNGERRRRFSYDDNGNLIDNDGDAYVYDFADRLGRVIVDGRDIRYLYDYAGRRVIKRIDGAQTSYIGDGAEVRDGRLIQYVFADESRRARVDGAMPAPPVAAQRVDLAPGWNLISFQVDPGSTDPADVLAGIDGLYRAVYAYDGAGYLVFVPGGQSNTLTSLRPGVGYWLDMIAPAQLVLEGPVINASLHVPANTLTLLGLPGLSSRALEDLLARHPSITGVWAYAGATRTWTTFNPGAPTYVNSLAEVEPGRGYWIVSDEDLTLTAPAPGPVYFYHADHLGSAGFVTDAAGALVSEFYNDPYGRLRHVHHAGNPFDPFYQFIDKERDDESGLHYFGARHYHALTGRFITPDPMFAEGEPTAGAAPPLENNLYAYALDNPVTRFDPDGHAAKHTIHYGDDGQVDYKIESTVYVYFDKSTDMYKWLHPRGKWDAKRAEQVARKLQKEFEKRVPRNTAHDWGTFSVKAKFKVVEKNPDALNPTPEDINEVTVLRFRRRTEDEKKAGLWGECSPNAGETCWFGEDPGRTADNANIYVDKKGNLKHAGSGHFHEVLHGFGLQHAVALNRDTNTWGPEGVPDILGYGRTEGSGKLTREVQTEFVRKVLERYGHQSHTLTGGHTWATGDIWSEDIQALYDAANP